MKAWLAWAAASVLLLSVACSPQKASEKAHPGAVKIRFVTDWRAEAEHGGIYEALATGEYAKRGLDVTIVQGGPGVNVPQLLAAGSAELGVGSNSFLVLQMAREGVPLKAVAAMMQKDPQVLMAHPDQGIRSIADMKGRPIFLSTAARDSFWPWLKAKYGFTDDQFRSYANSAPFVQEKRSIQQGYVFSEPYTIEKATGLKPQLFLLADNGYPSYAGMILAPDKFAAANPAAVKAFVEATAAGWNAYLNGDPKPADAMIMQQNPEQTADVLAQARDKMREYGIVQPKGMSAAQIGTMSDARWADTFKVAADLGLAPKDLDVHRAYTLEYLPAAAK